VAAAAAAAALGSPSLDIRTQPALPPRPLSSTGFTRPLSLTPETAVGYPSAAYQAHDAARLAAAQSYPTERTPLPSMRASVADMALPMLVGSPAAAALLSPAAAAAAFAATAGASAGRPTPPGHSRSPFTGERPITPEPPNTTSPAGPRPPFASNVSASHRPGPTAPTPVIVDDDTSPADDAAEATVLAQHAHEYANGRHYAERVLARPESADVRGREHRALTHQSPPRAQVAAVAAPASAPPATARPHSAQVALHAPTSYASPTAASAQSGGVFVVGGGGGGAARSPAPPASAPTGPARPYSAPAGRGAVKARGTSPSSARTGSAFVAHLSPPASSAIHSGLRARGGASGSAAAAAAVAPAAAFGGDDYMRDEYAALAADAGRGGLVPKASFLELHRRMLVDFGMPVESAQRDLERTLRQRQFCHGGDDVLTHAEFALLCLKFLAKW
jgi:hypothetical protein